MAGETDSSETVRATIRVTLGDRTAEETVTVPKWLADRITDEETPARLGGLPIRLDRIG